MRGLVRLSGPEAFAILDRVCVTDAAGGLLASAPANKRAGGQAASGTRDLDRILTVARLRDPVLPVLVSRFLGPNSYTGQDVAELQLPGNPALLDRLLRDCVQPGARLAEPGEFTFRAFLAGRMDLTQAEGIAATIAATSDGQLRAAGLLRAGRLGSFATDLVDRLGGLLALVEAGIDFTDQEDVVPIAPRKLDEGLANIATDLRQLMDRSRSWGTLEALPRVVLVGPPSAGKSTLFNALLGRERAVIHEQPGTTRDVLEEPLELMDDAPRRGRFSDPGGQARRIEIMLVDIAGLDDPTAALDREAQRLAREAITRADLILRLTSQDTEPHMSMRGFEGVPAIHVRTKLDLDSGAKANDDAIAVSGVTGEGLDILRAAIAQRLGERGVSVSGDMLALQPRHETALRDALGHLDEARRVLVNHLDNAAIVGVERVAAALRAALDALASLGGQLTPDDIIGRVFATFCVGK